ncbi:hypothetical protein PENTCL1PPCAC_5217, partial [Pristionchus entomophagus]
VSTVNVRNGCFATMVTGPFLDSVKSLKTNGYGNHSVEANTKRVVCECLNDDSNREKYVINTPQAPRCIANHYYDDTLKRCECERSYLTF